MGLYNARARAQYTHNKVDLSGKEVMHSDVGTCGGSLEIEPMMRFSSGTL